MFEDKIAGYPKLKIQVEKMMITKSSMKMIDVDKFSNFIITNYMKYYINFNSPAEIVYNAWTLYEKNYMTMNELYVTTELIKPVSILVEIPEESRQVTISKEQFYNLFSEHLKGKSNENIYSHQYKEVLNKVDTFSPKRVKKLFELSPCNMSTAEFKEEVFGFSTILKGKLDELFKGKKWKQIHRLDEKEYWISRIHAISRSIGVVNISLLKISLKLIKESIDFFLMQKRELLAGREDESDDEEAKGNISDLAPEKDPKRKTSNNKLSRNMSKIMNDVSGERVSTEQKSSKTSASILKMNTIKNKKLSSRKIKASVIENDATTPVSRNISTGKSSKARKSMSIQKTNLARSGFKNRKMPSFGGVNFK